jgi:hypothetical protein
MFDTRLAYDRFAPNIQVNYQVGFGTKAVSDALLCLLVFSLSLPASPSRERIDE